MEGWIKIHRKIVQHEIWNDVTTFRLFMLLLLKATHQDIVVKGVNIKRGQYLRSYSKLAEDLEYKEGRGLKKVSKSTILRCIKKLVSEEIVSISETEHGTLFTILKYEEYQGFEQHQETEHRTDNKPNAERTRNEVGTNPEQEQEQKNNNNKKNIKDNTCKRDKRIYKDDSDEMKLVEFFVLEIRKNDESFKGPSNKQTWCDDFRKIIEIDKRDKREISELIRWVQQNDFWKANVLSPKKLREKYTTLVIQMKEPPKQPAHFGKKVERVPDYLTVQGMQQIPLQVDQQQDEQIDFEAERQKILEKLGRA